MTSTSSETIAGATVGTRTLLKFARPVAGVMTWATILAAISSVLELLPFYFLYRAILVVLEGEAATALIGLGLAAGAAAALQTATWSAAMYVSHIAAYEQLHGLRVELMDRFTRLPLGEVGGRHSGDLQRVVVDDVFQLELFVSHTLPEFVSAVVSWAVVTIWLIAIDARLAIALGAVAAVAFVILLIGSRRTSAHLRATSEASGKLSRSLVELLDGLLTNAVLDRSGEPPRTLTDAVDDVAKTNSRWLGSFMPYGSAYLALMAVPTLLVIPVGGLLVLSGSTTPENFLFFIVIGLGYAAPIMRLRTIYFQLNRISYAAGVIDSVLKAEVQPDVEAAPPAHSADIAFENVDFGYEDEQVLRDVSFECPTGSLTAIVGPTGAGKSTIARLAARFWDVDSGRVTLGGIDVRELPLNHLLNQVSFVFQNTFLFRDTIAANLRVGRPDASDSDLVAAARAANVHDVIERLPQGYQTPIGTRGVTLSGGERQRLAIARAILHDSPVVVLDEATAFVDPDSEAILREAIHALTIGRTVLVIAHRLSTIVDADQILVVSDGQIVQRGKHDELIEEEGLYGQLWNDWQRTDPVVT